MASRLTRSSFILSIFSAMLFVIFPFALWVTQACYGQSDKSIEFRKYMERGDRLVAVKTHENLLRALTEYENALKLAPDNYEALCKISKAYIYILDVKTHTLLKEKKEYVPLLRKYGNKAVQYAEKANTINPEGKEAIAYYLQSYGYNVGSFGIFKLLFGSIPSRIENLAFKLIELDENFDGCTGYMTLGRLYYRAPRPVGDLQEAETYFKLSIENGCDTLQVHYWLAMVYLKMKKYDLSMENFEFVRLQQPHELERHFITEFKIESEKQLQRLKKKYNP
jgi:tetratricopeptide (TPR) repeat protein